jgi:hypothetical protein
MNNPRVSLKFITLTTLVALSAGLASGRAALSAQGGGSANDGEEFIFGTVGITASQTARLNVVNTATDGPAQTRALKFLDSSGNVIVTKTVTLAPSESAYLDINGAAIAGSGRVQIRALDPTCPTCRPNPTFGIIQTLELFDTVTGRTDIL